MRSSSNTKLAARTALVALALTACGTDHQADRDPPTPDGGIDPTSKQCEESYLDYQNFAAAFTNDWCRGCHGAAVPADMRQNAPLDVNFDDLAALRHFSERIAIRTTGATPTMPPAGGPSEEERALLAEWIACGARE